MLLGDSQVRTRTLPLKDRCHSGSASKIKISTKGLPKDFFHPQLFKSIKMRCHTQQSNQFQETSYFQTLNTPEPKREGRQYKSEQRKRASKKRLHQEEEPTKPNESFIMNCTFFRGREEASTHSSNKQSKSNSAYNSKAYHQANTSKHLQISTNKEELSNIFKARAGGGMFELSFHHRLNCSRGPLPLIRINKRMNG